MDVEVAGASFADLLLLRGEYQTALPLPCVPGSEFVGRVRQAGPGTTPAEGTRIIGLCRPPDGSYAARAIVIEQQSEPIPDDLPGPAAVCLIGNYVTAHLALHRRANPLCVKRFFWRCCGARWSGPAVWAGLMGLACLSGSGVTVPKSRVM